MGLLEKKLESVDSVDVPDVWADATTRSASLSDSDRSPTVPSGRSRVAVVVVSVMISVASVVYLYGAFSGSPDPTRPAQAVNDRLVFVSFNSPDGAATTITAVEPASRAIVQEFVAGAGATLAASDDGSRLYVFSSGIGGTNNLQVFDAQTGAPLDTVALLPTDSDSGERTQRVGPSCCESAAVSLDGEVLYYTVYADRSGHEQAIAAISTKAGDELATSPSIGACAPKQLLPLDNGQLAIVCGGNNLLMRVTRATAGLELGDPLSIPPSEERTDPQGNSLFAERVAAAAALPDHRLVVVTGSGMAHVIDTTLWEVVESHDFALAPDEVIPAGRAAVSPDGSRMFVGIGSTTDFTDASAKSAITIDLRSWDIVAEFDELKPFYSMLAPTDSELWLMDALEGRITAVDLSTGATEQILNPSAVDVPGNPASWIRI